LQIACEGALTFADGRRSADRGPVRLPPIYEQDRHTLLKGRVGYHAARWSPGKFPRSAQRGLVFFSSTRLSWLALDSLGGRSYPALARVTAGERGGQCL